ncbi:MAG TPA: T9SS type A sorting domain-containing protein [Lentimicrobium sp.]|nr:T9SS type A sorting domain-containing protein [Lentimicrobium sp.]
MSKLYYSVILQYFKKTCIFFLFFVIFINNGLAQNKVLTNHPALKSKDYLRSEEFVSARADQNGSMHNYISTLQKVRDSLRLNSSINIDNNRSVRNSYRYTQWYPLGPFINKDTIIAKLGQACSIWVDSTDFQTIYAGSNTGGLFGTYDGGNNWIPLTDNYVTTGVLAIDVDPDDKEHIFIGTGHWGFNRAYGEGVMESRDGGQTWTHTSLNSGIMTAGFLVHDLKINLKNHDTIYALLDAEFNSKTSIYRSTNNGQSWEEVFTRPKEELFDFVTTPARPDVVFAVGSLFLRSDDGGSTWKDQTDLFELKPNHKIARLTLAMTDKEPGYMLAFLESYDTVNPGSYDHRFYRSTNDGRFFRQIGIDYTPMASYWKMELQISPSNPEEFYLGGVWFFKYKSYTDTARYIEYSNHKYHKDVRDLLVFEKNGQDLVFMANDGGVTKSVDGAIKWIDITKNGFQATQFHNICTSDKGSMVYGGPQDGNVCFYNYDNGAWTTETHMADAYDGMVDFDSPKYVYIVTLPPKQNRKNIFLLKSDDGGLSFDYKGVPDTTENGRNSKPVAMHPTDPKIMFAGLTNVWKSTDRAETWQKISNFSQLSTNNNKLQCIEVAPSDPDVICVSFENPNWNGNLDKLMITTDGGNKWTDITPTGNYSVQFAAITDILIHPKNPAVIYLSLDRNWTDRRIYVSHNGGRTWENFSQGIPTVPINALRYFEGADYDILFAATDVGVYYRDGLMDSWQPFGSGLPLTIISDIEINYQRKKLVAGTFGRGLWEADICLPLDENSTTLTGTVEWPEGKNILGDLILMPGSKVTMTGKIEVGEGRTIKVLPGAQLILSGATLTNNCKSLWQGIKVYGNSDYDSGKPQGKLTMLYASSIENAYKGIDMIAMDENGIIDSLRGGGIIYAKKASLKNNLLSVDFKPTKGLNPSKFILTEFSVKSQVWPADTMENLVKVNSNTGIAFVSCIFRNDIPFTELSIQNRGTGLELFNSSVLLYKINSDSVPIGVASKPLFYQLRTGINASVTSPGYSLSLSEVTLKNNFTGLIASGYGNIVITKSSFELSAFKSIDMLNKEITGLYLDHCPVFSIYGNTFKGPTLPGFNNSLAGMVVNNCGNFNNLIADNTFKNLNYSILAQNRNRSNTGEEGLRFYYNKFFNNEYDICVTTDSLQPMNGVAFYQGTIGNMVNDPAGNHFSYNKIHRTSDFHNEGKSVIYSHYSNSNIETNQIPLLYANMWLMQSVYPIPDSAYIPQWLNSDSSSYTSQLTWWRENYNYNFQNFRSVLDGGNTNDLMNEIQNAGFYDAPELYKKLRRLDSNLSTELIKQLINNQEFPNTMLIDVLVNNPVIFRNEDVYVMLKSRRPELPAYMFERLINGPFNYSRIELIEAACHNAKAVQDFFIILKSNSLGLQYNQSACNLLSQLINDFQDHYALRIENIFNEYCNIENAPGKLEALKTDFPDKQDDIDKITILFQLSTELKTSHTDTLTGYQINLLNELLNDECTFIYAHNILKHYNKDNYTEPYLLPSGNPSLPTFNLPVVTIDDHSFKIYPQPANEFFIVDYEFKSGLSGAILEISNLLGHKMTEIPLESSYGQKLVDVNEFLPGMYILRLINNGSVVDHAKIMVFH